MTGKKQRKSLDDALARQFVYGGEDKPEAQELPQTEVSPAEPPVQKPSIKESLMSKLQQQQPKEATKRFTVDLPESMHRKLSILAARTGQTKADIVRMLLDEALADVED